MESAHDWRPSQGALGDGHGSQPFGRDRRHVRWMSDDNNVYQSEWRTLEWARCPLPH